MKPRRSALVVAAAYVAIATGAVGFVPLFGGPGYEQSLACGLLVPSAVAIAVALDTVHARAARAGEPRALLARGMAGGSALAGVALATALLHVARIGACDLAGGTLHFVLTAGIGAVLAGAWGAVAGWHAAAIRRPRAAAVALALAAPLGAVALSVLRFHATPIIFAFDPFVGYFSGTLYDTVVDAGPALLTYRLASVATLAGAMLVASSVEAIAPSRAAVRLGTGPGSPARLAFGAALLAASFGANAWGPALGWWQSSASIARELGGRVSGPRCTVVYPSSSPPADAALYLKDCEEELASVERVLGARGPERVTAFFFRDPAEKRRLMGAASTYIAKPWRAEVYLQIASYPHPVLGHELAHVVAGSFGRGPFRIAGALGGLWPNPGLIEGVAVAASPDDDELTDEQWSRAMLDAGILPSAESLFSMEFLGGSSARSYTAAGAFVRWVLDTKGAAAVRAWFGGAPPEKALDASLPLLDAAFREHLRGLALPDSAASYAKAKFDRKGLFGRRCPHLVDALRVEADACREARQGERAVRLYDAVLAKDPRDFASRHGRDLARARAGDAFGRADLLAMSTDDEVPRTWRDRADESLADLDALEGRAPEAAARYAAAAARSLDEDAGRTLEVKALAMRSPQGRRATEALLLGTAERPSDLVVAMVRLEELRATDPALVDYLVGKNLTMRASYADAAERLDRALALAPPTPRIGRELVRQRAIVACAVGDRDAVRRMERAVEESRAYADAAGGRRASVARLLARCALP